LVDLGRPGGDQGSGGERLVHEWLTDDLELGRAPSHDRQIEAGRAPVDDQQPTVRGQRAGLHGKLRGSAYRRMGIDTASAISLRQPGEKEERGVSPERRRRGHDQRSESSVDLLTDSPFGFADDMLGGVIRCNGGAGRLFLPPRQIWLACPAGGCVPHQQPAGSVHGRRHGELVGVSDWDDPGALVVADRSGHFGAQVHGERVVRHDTPPTEVRTRPP
jgi:hypothetical protein